MKKNKKQRKVTARPVAGKRTRILPLTIIIGAAALVGTLIFAAPRRQPAQKIATPAVHGEAINQPPQTNPYTAATNGPGGPLVGGRIMKPQSNLTAETGGAGPKIEKPVKRGDYLIVGFDKLGAFPIQTRWVLTNAIMIRGKQTMKDEVPADIKALDQSKVAVEGFMMPVKLENGMVTEFFLMKSQARCCYGLPILPNEMLVVHMAGPPVKCVMDQPVTLYGKLHVSETYNENGALNSIYTMDGDKMGLPNSM